MHTLQSCRSSHIHVCAYYRSKQLYITTRINTSTLFKQ